MAAKTSLTRREFMGRTLAGVEGAGLVGANPLGSEERNPRAPAVSTPPAGALITRTLGKTGMKIPIVSMGVMNSDLPALVRKAYDLGIRHLDTAASYWRGRNEEMVGRVVKELGVRDKVVVATKIWTPQYRHRYGKEEGRAKFLEMLEASLKRLRFDHVDILYAHDVSDVKDLSEPAFLEGLAAAKKQGKARAVGFSTHREMGACLREAVKLGCFDVVLTTYNYSLHPYPDLLETMKAASASGIGLVAMKTQCQQDWYREELPAELQSFYSGTIMHSALLKWVLNHECFASAAPGFTTFGQLEEDIACASSLAYSPQEKKFLEDRRVKLAVSSACRQCGECVATCPRGADIPRLMRAHMYAFSYGNPVHARETLEEASGGLDACRDCGMCRAACSGRVAIGRRIDRLIQAFA